MSQHLDSLEIGDTVDMRGPKGESCIYFYCNLFANRRKSRVKQKLYGIFSRFLSLLILTKSFVQTDDMLILLSHFYKYSIHFTLNCDRNNYTNQLNNDLQDT